MSIHQHPSIRGATVSQLPDAKSDTHTPDTPWWKVLLAVLATLLGGPLIGSVLLMIGLGVQDLFFGTNGSLTDRLGGLLISPVVGMIIWPFAMVMVGVAAVISACIVGLIVWRHGTISYVASVLTGVGSVISYLVAIEPQLVTGASGDRLEFVGVASALAAAAALIIRACLGRFLSPRPRV